MLSWIIDRCEGRAQAQETPIGFLPRPEDLDLKGIKLSDDALQQLIDIDQSAWHTEIDDIGKYLESYGTRMPQQLKDKHRQVQQALG